MSAGMRRDRSRKPCRLQIPHANCRAPTVVRTNVGIARQPAARQDAWQPIDMHNVIYLRVRGLVHGPDDDPHRNIRQPCRGDGVPFRG